MTAPFLFDLRDASPRDLETLTALWHEGWRDAHLSVVPASLARLRTVESFRERLREGLSSVRVAEHGGVAVGLCWVKDDEVYQCYVAAEARGTGVSAALLADGEARIASAGGATAWLTCAIGNDRAARFYEKHGWRRAGTVTSELHTPEGPFHLDVWRYEKALKAAVPTLFEWAGGAERLQALFRTFYERVRDDDVIGPVFAHMDAHHAEHVASFVGEVFGGPSTYSDERGGHAAMIRRHMTRHLTEVQRRRWVMLLLEAADAVGVPDDPEFRSALVGYLEWGSRLAVINSQGEASEPAQSPMPAWNWGPPGGPWQG